MRHDRRASVRRRHGGPRIFSVAEVAFAAKDTLEDRFSNFWVEGEVSSYRGPNRQGHHWFSLSDESAKAVLPVTLWAMDAQRHRLELRNGMRLRIRGHLTVYPGNGRFQLVAKQMVPAGEGDLAAKFEALKKKLQAEGLLDEARKRGLPLRPKAIGVVTSQSSAALRDVIRVAHNRGNVRLIVADATVQGERAPRSVALAIENLAKHPDVEVMIVTRGGGSAEDLWGFNHEDIARAIARCPIPVVCGIGHESDISIAELVADVRASTPSNAAELVVREDEALRESLFSLERRLQRSLESTIQSARLRLTRFERRLGTPRNNDTRRALEALARRAENAMRGQLESERDSISRLRSRLEKKEPRKRLREQRARLRELETALREAQEQRLRTDRKSLENSLSSQEKSLALQLASARERFARAAATLDALSPLAVLTRGYSLVLAGERAVRDASELKPGDRVSIRFRKGSATAVIDQTEGSADAEESR